MRRDDNVADNMFCVLNGSDTLFVKPQPYFRQSLTVEDYNREWANHIQRLAYKNLLPFQFILFTIPLIIGLLTAGYYALVFYHYDPNDAHMAALSKILTANWYAVKIIAKKSVIAFIGTMLLCWIYNKISMYFFVLREQKTFMNGR